jgi:hypothetical protein
MALSLINGFKGREMRNFVLGCLMAAGFVLAGVTMASAAPAGSTVPRGTVAGEGTVQNVEWGYCDRLRRSCARGYDRDSCAMYRDECRRPGSDDRYERRESYEPRYSEPRRYTERQRRCSQLRFACREKERLGEEGQGNCRRYREECGGD